MVCDYEYDSEKEVMRVNCLNCIYGSSIEDSDVCMAKTIEKLMEIKKAVRIVFSEAREHEYDYPDSRLLLGVANAVDKIIKEKII